MCHPERSPALFFPAAVWRARDAERDLLFHPVAAETIAYYQGLDPRTFRHHNIPGDPTLNEQPT